MSNMKSGWGVSNAGWPVGSDSGKTERHILVRWWVQGTEVTFTAQGAGVDRSCSGCALRGLRRIFSGLSKVCYLKCRADLCHWKLQAEAQA